MISGNFTCFQLNALKFNKLFEEHFYINTPDVLSQSAVDSNLDCIDILHNPALHRDYVGEMAETILFNLFSGKASDKKGIDNKIQPASSYTK